MRSWRSSGRGDARIGRASARPRCTPTRATTSPPAGGCCAAGGSRRGSPDVGLSRQPGWAVTAGRSSSLAWLLANRRLTVRYARRADILTAFLYLACALICAGKLPPL